MMLLKMDMKTVYILLSLGHLFTMMFITAYRYKQPKDNSYLIFYAAKGCQAFTWALLAIPDGTVSMAVLATANLVFLLGVGLETLAMMRIVEESWSHGTLRYYAWLIAGSMGAYLLVVLLQNTESLRIFVVSVAVALFLLPPALRMIGSMKRSALHALMGYLYLLMAAGLLIRTGLTLFPVLPVTVNKPGPYQTLSFLSLYLMMTLGNAGFVLISKEKADRELYKLASRDDLTGALNRRSFVQEAGRLMDDGAKHCQPVTFILLDLDNFKAINDAFGHDAGDAVLKELAGNVRLQLGGRELFGRYGGDEFAIFLPEAEEAYADAKAEGLLKLVREPGSGKDPAIGEPGIRYTISMGMVTEVPGPGITLDRLYKAADEALYQAKREGRNCAARGRMTPNQKQEPSPDPL